MSDTGSQSKTQYLLGVHHGDEITWPDGVTMEQVYADVDAFNQRVQSEGAWVFGGGLMPASSATVVDASGVEVVTTDGPYLESKEYLGGFWVIQAADLDEALRWGRDASAACHGPVEVRPFQPE
ncbi:MAG: YciI family protein [Micromonosporaceae bacterium]